MPVCSGQLHTAASKKGGVTWQTYAELCFAPLTAAADLFVVQSVSAQDSDSGLTVMASFSFIVRSQQKAWGLPSSVTSISEHAWQYS